MDKRLKTKKRKALEMTLAGNKRVVRYLKSYFFQNGKWKSVGDILR